MLKQRRLLAMVAAAGGIAAAAAVPMAFARADDGVSDAGSLTLVSAGPDVPYTALGVDGYVDPVLQVAGPRFLVLARLAYQPRPEWTFGLEADFSTLWANQSPVLLPGALPPDETWASVVIPVRYWLSGNAFLEGGARWSDRGPAFSAPGSFHFDQRLAMVYANITLTTRTEAPPRFR